MSASLHAEIAELLGPQGVLTGDAVRTRACDPFENKPNLAQAVYRPATVQEVSAVLRKCCERNQRVVVQGGRTGVSGGAQCAPEDVVLSLERMNEIESVCRTTRTIVAQAGVTIQQLQDAAQEQGLFYPVDLGSRGTATVGGTLATNAGGNRTIRWGMTRERVLGLEAVLADGTVVSSMNTLIKNNTGYELKHLFIGAEGTLGVITRAVFRLVERPSSHNVALLTAAKYEDVVALLSAAQRLSTLSAFEVMWNDFYTVVTEAKPDNKPISSDYPYYVLIEGLGYHEDQDAARFEAFLEDVHERGLAAEVVLAQSDRQRESLWKIRESVDVAVRALAPVLTFDISLDITRVQDYVNAVRENLQKQFPSARMLVNGHLGDNNIHIGATVGPDTPAQEPHIERIVYETLRPFGGSISAEHGIGTKKKAYLGISRTREEIALMRQLKRVLDPKGILNASVLFE
jgi:FAD/FMN-containing dehydrogenase